MCCRFLLTNDHARALLARLGATLEARMTADQDVPASRYNIAPGADILAVRNHGARREAAGLRWGFVPAWAASPVASPPVNARSESVADKPMFRDSLRHRRCVIPASGFYEWERRGGARLPWLFHRAGDEPFLLAGLWDAWSPRGAANAPPPETGALESCVIITTTANRVMAPVHHRMPVMLTLAEAERWLDPGVTQADALLPLLRPWDDAVTAARRVSMRVNHTRCEGPECLAAPSPDEGTGAAAKPGSKQPGDTQLSLDF